MNECEIIIQKALGEGRSSPLIDEAQQICNWHSIPTPMFHVTSRLDEATMKAKETGFQGVLKIVSSQILHKSDVGGVTLNIKDLKELAIGYEKMVTEVGRRASTAKISGVLVEKMMPPSTEVIAGGLRDSQFWPSIIGMGGIFTEVYEDVAFRVAPIDKVDALNDVRELKGSKILEGVSGKPPAYLNSIINLLINVSNLILEHDAITQLNLNPVIAYPDGVCAG